MCCSLWASELYYNAQLFIICPLSLVNTFLCLDLQTDDCVSYCSALHTLSLVFKHQKYPHVTVALSFQGNVADTDTTKCIVILKSTVCASVFLYENIKTACSFYLFIQKVFVKHLLVAKWNDPSRSWISCVSSLCGMHCNSHVMEPVNWIMYTKILAVSQETTGKKTLTIQKSLQWEIRTSSGTQTNDL